MPALQSGHVSRSLSSHLKMHGQQYRWPQGVTTGSVGLSLRQMEQLHGFSLLLLLLLLLLLAPPPPAEASITGRRQPPEMCKNKKQRDDVF